MLIELTLNSEPKRFEAEPEEVLATVLRREGYLGLKRGCQDGSCGACTVLLDDIAVRSCLLFVAQAAGHEVTTIEGLGTIESPHPLQQAFVDHGAVQCGYCIPGMVLVAKALLDEIPSPTREEVCEALDGNLCRCTGYVKQIDAVMATSQHLQKGEE